MERLKMTSCDVVSGNVAKIAALFPHCVTERLGSDGQIELAIDFDKLKAELSHDVIEAGEERYQFTWPEKRKASRLANESTTLTLRPCRKESVDFDTTENLYIEGDNLDVLKVLRETYLGKVKMIYIDPPYNTGTDFVYNDYFAQVKNEYEATSGVFDEDGNQVLDPMQRNNAANGRFHTKWLNMIYPRLKVARDLLTDDGVIFISIDDKEVSNMIQVCSEIFGNQNFVGNIIWQSRTSISNDDEISTNHNHTLVYSRNRDKLTFGGEDIDVSEYINPDDDPRGPWKLVPIDANHVGGDTTYAITNPKTGVDFYPPNGRIWCYNKTTLDALMADGRIKFGLSDDSSPKRKLFLNERKAKGDCKTPSSILLDAGTTKLGTSEIMALFDNDKVFDYPKPTTLVSRLMKYGFLKDDDIVLDFFSGSGTTAHASFVYSLSESQRIKFILVQIAENLDRNLITASNDAKKSIRFAITMLESINKPHYLTEVAKERIRRAGKKIKEEAGEKAVGLDTGFRVLKLDTSNMEDVYYTPDKLDPTQIDGLIDNIKSDRTGEDLLFQVMLTLGIELSAKIQQKKIGDKDVFSVNDDFLLACFDKDIDESAIEAMAKLHPNHLVIRDASAASDSVLDNFSQIIASHSTEKKITTHIL